MEFTGYPIELERREELMSTATEIRFSATDYDAPEEVDPRGRVRHDKQGNMNSCQGFSLSNCGEFLRVVSERLDEWSKDKQFSALFAYIESQRMDGIAGRDGGSTISGGLKVAKEIGFCPESLLEYETPYPRNATRVITQNMRQAAGAFKVRSHAWLESYDDIKNYLASGAGAVNTGTAWNDSFYGQGGVLENIRFTAKDGGHATAWLGYSKRKDSRGRNYIWRLNSHNDSWTEIAPSVIDQLCRHRFTSIVGISDLTTPEPRPFDWSKVKWLG